MVVNSHVAREIPAWRTGHATKTNTSCRLEGEIRYWKISDEYYLQTALRRKSPYVR